jgi:tetratricopeptide (TPR) repeat protein
MKLSARFVVPIVAAILLAGSLAVFLSFSLQQSAKKIEQQLQGITSELSEIGVSTMEDAPIDAGDRALLHLRRGDLAAIQGNWAQAETDYTQAVDAGGGITALKKLAQAQLQRRELDAVRTTLDRLRSEGARDEDLLLIESVMLIRSGEIQKASERLHASVDTPHKHYALALLSIVQGDHTLAKSELTTVINGWEPVLRTYAKELQKAYEEYAQFPESPEIHLTTLLSRSLAEVRECELALPLLTHVLEKRDNYRDAWIVQGYCELTTERFQEAERSLERAYGLDPEKPETQYFLARAHAALGDHGNALTFFQYALKNGFKPEREVREHIALEALATGDTALALKQYAAVTALPDIDSDAYVQYITLALQQGKAADVYDIAKEATSKWPDEAQTWELLGLTAADLQKKDEAKEALTKALQMDPSLEKAREKLGKL